VTASGGQGIMRTRHALGLSPGQVRITYDMYSIPDRLDCFYNGDLRPSAGRSDLLPDRDERAE
jgi:hypothetical protein